MNLSKNSNGEDEGRRSITECYKINKMYKWVVGELSHRDQCIGKRKSIGHQTIQSAKKKNAKLQGTGGI